MEGSDNLVPAGAADGDGDTTETIPLRRQQEESTVSSPSPTSNWRRNMVEYAPIAQGPAALISLSLSTVMAILGCVFLLFPRMASTHIYENSDVGDMSIEMFLSRITGGVVLSQGLSSIALLLPIFDDLKAPSSSAVDKCRMSIGMQCLFGLLLIICSLLEDQEAVQNQGQTNQFLLLVYGFVFLLLGCCALMCSFWPVSIEIDGDPSRARQNTQSAAIFGADQGTFSDEEATEPLLSNENHGTHDLEEDTEMEVNENDGYRLIEDVEAAEEDGDDVNDEDGTSRIRGTRRLLQLAKSQVFYLYLGCAVLLVRLPFSLSIPHFVSTTIGCLSRGDFSGARHEVLLLFFMGTIDACLDFWCLFLFGYADLKIVRGVRIDTFTSILKQEMAFFDFHSSGELASRLNSDCGQMAGDLTWFFRFSIESVVRISGIATYMLIRCPTLGGCALSVIPLVAVINKFFSNWLSRNARMVQDALAEANKAAQETFSCIRTVISFAAEQFELEKYVERVNRQYDLNVKQVYMTGLYYMTVSTFLVNTFVQSMLLLVGAKLLEHGKLTVEILLAFMLYQGQLQNEMMNLFQSYTSLIKSSGAGDRIFELLDRIPPEPGTGSPSVRMVNENDSSSERQYSTNEANQSVSLRLDNVHFSYPSRQDQPVLKGIDLEVAAGKTLAIVGPSGAGKSSVVGLIQRFYDPCKGRILVDGLDLKAIKLKDFRRRVGVVNQDNTLFAGTILSNITYGMPLATKDQAIEAAKLANAHPFINSFPNGYETECGERGVQLSGGQKQRIAIARAIIRHPSLLLLDEATSALDAESEHLVQKALDSLLKTNVGTTTIVVAHRLRTVRNADVIVVVRDGRVVEQGMHEELLALGGHYKEMVERSHGDQLSLDE